MEISPDRGDGARMSFIQIADSVDGLEVYFADVQGTSDPANFVTTQIASGLDRNSVHRIKLTMDIYDGPSNDVVKVYLNCGLVHTGTSWENYYYFDPESNDGASDSRIIKTAIFMTRSKYGLDPTPLTADGGFYIDNVLIGVY